MYFHDCNVCVYTNTSKSFNVTLCTTLTCIKVYCATDECGRKIGKKTRKNFESYIWEFINYIRKLKRERERENQCALQKYYPRRNKIYVR